MLAEHLEQLWVETSNQHLKPPWPKSLEIFRVFVTAATKSKSSGEKPQLLGVAMIVAVISTTGKVSSQESVAGLKSLLGGGS